MTAARVLLLRVRLRLSLLGWCSLMVWIVSGCSKPQSASAPVNQAAPLVEERASAPSAGSSIASENADQFQAKALLPASDEAVKVPAAQIQRKIIYTAHIEVMVKDIDVAVAEVQQLMQGHNGYVASSEVRGQIGQQRHAVFTLRVPVENFSAVRDALLRLGLAERNALESRDVTEEYVDVEARLRILKQEEEALGKILRETTNRQELLLTRQRLMEVRSQIEAAQGRLNLLSRLSALATIHLKLREQQHYQPPETLAAPTYLQRVRTTLTNSYAGLVRFSEEVSLAVVAALPWAPVWLPSILLAVWLWRRRWARR